MSTPVPDKSEDRLEAFSAVSMIETVPPMIVVRDAGGNARIVVRLDQVKYIERVKGNACVVLLDGRSLGPVIVEPQVFNALCDSLSVPRWASPAGGAP